MEEAIIISKKAVKGHRKPFIDVLINGQKDTLIDITMTGDSYWVATTLHAKEDHNFSFNPFSWLKGGKFTLNGINYEVL